MTGKLYVFVVAVTLICNCVIAQANVQIDVKSGGASIENNVIAIEFDLSDGTYSGIDKSDNTKVFKDAWYRIGQGGWYEPKYVYKAERLGHVVGKFGEGATLRVWYLPQESYDPSRFLDITVY